MASLWNPSRGWVIRDFIEAHELREQVQALPLDQLRSFAEILYGPPAARKRGEVCRRELDYRQEGRDVPFR